MCLGCPPHSTEPEPGLSVLFRVRWITRQDSQVILVCQRAGSFWLPGLLAEGHREMPFLFSYFCGLVLNNTSVMGKQVLAPGQPQEAERTAPCILSPVPRGEEETQTHTDTTSKAAARSGDRYTRTAYHSLTKSEEPGSIEAGLK